MSVDPLLQQRRARVASLFAGDGRIDLAELLDASGGAALPVVNKRFLVQTTVAAEQHNKRTQLAQLWSMHDAGAGERDARSAAVEREAARRDALAIARAEEALLEAQEDAAAANMPAATLASSSALQRPKRGRGGVGAKALDGGGGRLEEEAQRKDAQRRREREERRARRAHKREKRRT
jgi:hypothetical protein